MGVRRSWLVLAVLLAPAGVRAGDHQYSVFVAPSRAENPNSNPGTTSVWNGGLSTRQAGLFGDGWGWHVTGEVTLKNENLKKRLSFIGDASGHLVGADRKRDATQITVMVGPRWALPVLGKGHAFVHFMGFGAIQRSDSRLNVSASTLAVALGGGVDVIPADEGHAGVRVQVDWIVPLGTDVEKSWRISTGFVYRFH